MKKTFRSNSDPRRTSYTRTAAIIVPDLFFSALQAASRKCLYENTRTHACTSEWARERERGSEYELKQRAQFEWYKSVGDDDDLHRSYIVMAHGWFVRARNNGNFFAMAAAAKRHTTKIRAAKVRTTMSRKGVYMQYIRPVGRRTCRFRCT